MPTPKSALHVALEFCSHKAGGAWEPVPESDSELEPGSHESLSSFRRRFPSRGWGGHGAFAVGRL